MMNMFNSDNLLTFYCKSNPKVTFDNFKKQLK